MRRSMDTLHFSPSKAAIGRAINIGLATNILRYVSPVRSFNYVENVLIPALRHKFIKFYFNSRGDEVAFVVWAFLAPGVEEQFVRNSQWNLHISEWNEGEELWILDLVAPHGHFRGMVEDLAKIFDSVSAINYFRVKDGRIVRGRWERNKAKRPSLVRRRVA